MIRSRNGSVLACGGGTVSRVRLATFSPGRRCAVRTSWPSVVCVSVGSSSCAGSGSAMSRGTATLTVNDCAAGRCWTRCESIGSAFACAAGRRVDRGGGGADRRYLGVGPGDCSAAVPLVAICSLVAPMKLTVERCAAAVLNCPTVEITSRCGSAATPERGTAPSAAASHNIRFQADFIVALLPPNCATLDARFEVFMPEGAHFVTRPAMPRALPSCRHPAPKIVPLLQRYSENELRPAKGRRTHWFDHFAKGNPAITALCAVRVASLSRPWEAIEPFLPP